MLLLAIDASGRQGGITLARGNDREFQIVESAAIQGRTFSAELIPQVSELLSRHGLTPWQLEGLVAVTGPGSFTGLRVGLTAIKGLSEVLKLPIADVTSLEVLKAATGSETGVLPLLDAGRGEVYVTIQNDGRIEELLLSIIDATQLAKARNLRIIVAEAPLAAKFENTELTEFRGSEIAARLGLKKLLAGNTVDVLALDANYIRKTEDEYLQRLKK